jgi:EAL domain-containing protein (putative c-di-GMP-specific phosphodiesterase class I)
MGAPQKEQTSIMARESNDQGGPRATEAPRSEAELAARTEGIIWMLSGKLSPNHPMRYIPICSSPFVVGRRSDLSLCLPSQAVSSIHAEFACEAASLTLRDAGSTNGTYVNGVRVTEPVPLKADDLVQFADVLFRVLKHTGSATTATVCEDVVDEAMALVQFDRLMNDEAVVPHYQPVVSLYDERVRAYEVLGRSRVAGLEKPAAMFLAASQLSVEAQLSQMIRWKAINETAFLADPPHLFVNTHPAELQQPGLIASITALREVNRKQAITVEIHESAVTEAATIMELGARLRELNVGLAFDDFGAGQARLKELTEVQPDYLKFDMSLIRSLHTAPKERRQLVGTLVRMSRDIGISPLAEGIECDGEKHVCLELGFELAQGYHFGKPARLLCDRGAKGLLTDLGSDPS